jgi:hypothetical protein
MVHFCGCLGAICREGDDGKSREWFGLYDPEVWLRWRSRSSKR